MKKIRETKYQENTRAHETKKIPDDVVRFSFRYINFSDKFPLNHSSNYIVALFERLRDVSQISISDFLTDKNKTLRSHSHNWDSTSEPDGYAHLNEHLRQCQPWQFSLSKSEHGRIHGIILDNIFYIIWLDPHHNLYT